MKDKFWPWWWNTPCNQCPGCVVINPDDPFAKCESEEKWLAKKPQYNQSTEKEKCLGKHKN